MAVEMTPLGFKKPDGVTELVKNGAGVISDNAQKAQDILGTALPKLAAVELAAFTSGALAMIEDPTDPGFYILGEPLA